MNKSSQYSGFTLVEVLIAAAALAGLALVGMQLTKTQTKSGVKASFDNETLLITNEINGILSDPAKCLATFATTATPTSINGKFPITGGPYGNGQVKINSFTLTGIAPDGILKIAFNNKVILKGSSAVVDIPKIIKLTITGSPGAITNCRSVSTATSDIWIRGTGANINDISYNAGKVGIGTLAPKTALDVVGGIRAGAATPGDACTPLGAQAYNSATGAPLYCSNLAVWTAPGGALSSCMVVNSGVSWNTATATCPADYKMTGGGCNSVPNTGYFRGVYPNSTSSFFCWDITSQNIIAYAICCK